MVGTLIRRPLPPVSDFIRTLLDDTSATAALATLGVGPRNIYTPTLFNTTNVAASTANTTTYYPIGDIVLVWGFVSIDPTAAGAVTNLGMSIPIASNFANAAQAGGTFAAGGIEQGGQIAPDIANDRVTFTSFPGSAVNVSYYFTFMYQVI